LIEEVTKLLGKKKLLMGREATLKAMRKGQLEKIFCSSNIDSVTRKDLDYYGSISNIEIVTLSETNEELGVACKKPFSISVIGVLK